jgi:thioredoxin
VRLRYQYPGVSPGRRRPPSLPVMQTSHVRELHTGSFDEEVLGAAGPVLVDFSADWCPPCKMIDPVVEELAASLAGQVTVGRLDVDRDPEVSIRYGVLGMPTLILFVGGRPVDRLVGFSTPGHVRRWVTDAVRAAAAAS